MSAPASSHRAVVAALCGNCLITVAKFTAFLLSGSGAMLSEAIHSTADAGNQLLLFLGLTRAGRERDDEFNYGYGAERFVFGLLSAAGIFFIGCGVTVYHGVHNLMNPRLPEFGPVTAVVLVLSFLIEGGSMAVAVACIRKEAKGKRFMRFLLHEADPAAFAIVLEDGAALLGLVLAAAGIALAWATGNPAWDALGSVLVGLLLGLIAIQLARENRELLLGRAAPHDVVERFTRIIRSTPGVRHVHDVKTRRLTPEVYKLKAEVSLDEAFLARKLEPALPANGVPDAASRARTLDALARRAVMAVSDLVDEIEARVRAEIPEARHIDLEVDHTAEKRSAGGGPT